MADDLSPAIRYADSLAELDAIEPLWNALQVHHAEITPELGPETPARSLAEAWRVRRGKYEHWLGDPDTFIAIAERDRAPVGYAFVTVGPGYASWATGERAAVLETLSVLPAERGAGAGEALLEAVWARLSELGVADLSITTTGTNVDAHRFYERHGFEQRFVLYYGRQR